jgi:hypothetical protein
MSKSEFENVDCTMCDLMKVPHDENQEGIGGGKSCKKGKAEAS